MSECSCRGDGDGVAGWLCTMLVVVDLMHFVQCKDRVGCVDVDSHLSKADCVKFAVERRHKLVHHDGIEFLGRLAVVGRQSAEPIVAQQQSVAERIDHFAGVQCERDVWTRRHQSLAAERTVPAHPNVAGNVT